MSTRMHDLMFGALGELRHEPLEWRLRAELGSREVVDSTRAILVWEPRRVVPSYAVPAGDIRAELTTAATGTARTWTASCTRDPVRRAHGRGRRGGDRRPRRRRVPARRCRPAPTTSCSTSTPSTRGTRRTSGVEGHPREPYPPRRRPPQRRGPSGSSSAARWWPDHERAHASPRRACRCASTSRARTSAPISTGLEAHPLPVQGPCDELVGRRRRAPARGPRLELRGAAAGRRRHRGARRVLGRARRRVRRR